MPDVMQKMAQGIPPPQDPMKQAMAVPAGTFENTGLYGTGKGANDVGPFGNKDIHSEFSRLSQKGALAVQTAFTHWLAQRNSSGIARVGSGQEVWGGGPDFGVSQYQQEMTGQPANSEADPHSLFLNFVRDVNRGNYSVPQK